MLNIFKKKYFQNKLLETARDLLFNDNRTKLNDETLQKLAFLNGTAHQDHNAKLTGIPELNSTGLLNCDLYTYFFIKLLNALMISRRNAVQ